jgi:hypothetical protein
MTKKKKNPYEEKAKQKSLFGLGNVTTAESKKEKTSVTQMLAGGIGGGLAGVVAGRASLLLGLAITGGGYFLGSPTATMFGVGLMASGGYQTASSVLHGTSAEGVDGLKERFDNFKNGIKHQLFLDKLRPKKQKEKDETTQGVEQTQFFRHPQIETGKLDFSEAERIERQINESGRQFESTNGVGEIQGMEGVEDKLF